MKVKLSPYEEYLERTIDHLFGAAQRGRVTWHAWAEQAGVAPSTVYRLGERETRFPQLRTVFLLARALEIELAPVRQRRKSKRRRAA